MASNGSTHNKGLSPTKLSEIPLVIRRGCYRGDRLIGIGFSETDKFQPVVRARDVQIYLDQAEVGGKLHYLMERPSYPPETRFYYADLDNLGSVHKWDPRTIYVNLIGIVYLIVGFFVLFKQGGRAPFVLHFAVLCLTAFVFHFYTPGGHYRDLDLAIAFLKNAAFIIFAPLFLHFCLLYPTRHQLFTNKRWRAVMLYVPSFLLLVLAVWVFLRDELAKFVPPIKMIPAPSESFIGAFYKISFLHFLVALVASAVLLVRTFVSAKKYCGPAASEVGSLGSTAGNCTFYFPLRHHLPASAVKPIRWLTDAAILPLILIPFAFGYSVLRYRLMDVELVVRRVFVYALTTLAIALLIGVVVYTAGLYAFGSEQHFTSGEITLRVVIAVLAMAAIVMVAAPVKNFLQERVDRFFYGERYDLRLSLLDFGRTLSATTALDPLLDALVNRLQEVMNVGRIAIFVEDKRTKSGYVVARADRVIVRDNCTVRLPRDDSCEFG